MRIGARRTEGLCCKARSSELIAEEVVHRGTAVRVVCKCAESNLRDEVGLEQTPDVNSYAERLPSTGVTDRVLELIQLLNTPLRHILRDSEGRVVARSIAYESRVVECNVIELCKRIGDGISGSGELSINASLRSTEFVEQIRRKDVRPASTA